MDSSCFFSDCSFHLFIHSFSETAFCSGRACCNCSDHNSLFLHLSAGDDKGICKSCQRTYPGTRRKTCKNKNHMDPEINFKRRLLFCRRLSFTIFHSLTFLLLNYFHNVSLLHFCFLCLLFCRHCDFLRMNESFNQIYHQDQNHTGCYCAAPECPERSIH